jgi:hypothetical protein
MILETNGFGGMSNKIPSRPQSIDKYNFIQKSRSPNIATLHIVNTVLTLNSHIFLIRVSLKC